MGWSDTSWAAPPPMPFRRSGSTPSGACSCCSSPTSTTSGASAAASARRARPRAPSGRQRASTGPTATLLGQREGLRLRRIELQRAGVHAVALTGWPRTVGEDVAQVTPAAPALDLGADHAVAAVLHQFDVFGHRGLIEAGPPGPGFELGARGKQLRAAAGAAIGPVVLEVDVLAGEGAFGGGVAQDLELIWAQALAPLLFGEVHLVVCV